MFHGELDVQTALGLKELRKRISVADIPDAYIVIAYNNSFETLLTPGTDCNTLCANHYI